MESTRKSTPPDEKDEEVKYKSTYRGTDRDRAQRVRTRTRVQTARSQPPMRCAAMGLSLQQHTTL